MMFRWVRLGYVGGCGRAPAARQARGPSAAARQARGSMVIMPILGGGGGYTNIHLTGKRKITQNCYDHLKF
jgi:hypothetical protein